MTATAHKPKRKQQQQKQSLDLTVELSASPAHSMSTSSSPAISIVKPEGRVKRVGYQVECSDCGWSSFRYDQRTTAELIRDSHAERCLGSR